MTVWIICVCIKKRFSTKKLLPDCIVSAVRLKYRDGIAEDDDPFQPVALFLVLPGEDAQDIEFEEEDEELSSSDGEDSEI